MILFLGFDFFGFLLFVFCGIGGIFFFVGCWFVIDFVLLVGMCVWSGGIMIEGRGCIGIVWIGIIGIGNNWVWIVCKRFVLIVIR